MTTLILLAATSGSPAWAQQTTPGAGLPPKVASLIYQLQEDDPKRKYQAASELLKVNPLPPDAIAELFHTPLDLSVLKAMADSDQRALSAVTTALNDPRNERSEAGAIMTLGTMARRNPTFWPALIELFKSDDPQVRFQASAQFGGLTPADAKVVLPLMCQALRDTDPRVRHAALRAAGMLSRSPNGSLTSPVLGGNGVLSEITALLNDADPHTRSEAAHTIEFMSPTPMSAVPNLLAALKDPVRDVRKSAAGALLRIDPHHREIVPVLIDVLSTSELYERSAIVASFGRMGTDAQDAVPTIEHLLTDQDTEVRIAAIDALRQVSPKSAVLPLAQVLIQDKDEKVREAAVKAIGQLPADDARAAIPALLHSEHDDDTVVRNEADTNLQIMGKSAYPGLIAALQNSEPDIREAAVKTLSQQSPLPDEVAKVLTNAAFKDKSLMVRNAAALALQKAHLPAGDVALAQLDKADKANPITKGGERSYTREQIIAAVPSDADNTYPMELYALIPINFFNDSPDSQEEKAPPVLVSVHRGRERSDRLGIWKRVGRNRYQILKAVGADNERDDQYETRVFFPNDEPPDEEVRFLYVLDEGWRYREEILFAIERTANGEIQLPPATIESAHEVNQHKPKPEEKVSTEEYGVAQLENGAYKIVRETLTSDEAPSSTVERWRFLPIVPPKGSESPANADH